LTTAVGDALGGADDMLNDSTGVRGRREVRFNPQIPTNSRSTKKNQDNKRLCCKDENGIQKLLTSDAQTFSASAQPPGFGSVIANSRPQAG
jgi:hypothetical protein